MQVIVPVKVSADAFYQILLTSLQNEVLQITGKQMNEKQLEGLQYKKKSTDGKRDVKVHVHQLKTNRKYCTSFSNGELYTKISYELKPISDHACKITYCEESSQAPKKCLFHAPERRAKKMIHTVEKYILKQQKQ